MASENRSEPLWREVVGDVLRRERLAQERRLADVASEAGISVQYLSEMERGRKDPSSEMLAAAAGALGLSLWDVLEQVRSAVATPIRLARAVPTAPSAGPHRALALAA